MLFFDENWKLNKPNSNKTLDDIVNDPKMKYAVEEYLIIRGEFKNSKPLKDNVIFRDCFSQLYGLYSRRSTLLNFNCADGFFETFEKIKNTSYFSDNDLYTDIIKKLYENNINTVGKEEKEWVFASKILHTINNRLPIIDSHVENMFNSVGIEVSRKNYKEFANAFADYIANNPEEVNMIIERFNYAYGYVDIDPVKIIDFVLWIADQ